MLHHKTVFFFNLLLTMHYTAQTEPCIILKLCTIKADNL